MLPVGVLRVLYSYRYFSPVANTSPAATVTRTPPTTSVGAASPSQTSNGAVSVEAKKGGILGLMGFLALMVV